MSFNRLNDLRSSYHGLEKRGRSFFKKRESPLLGRKQLSLNEADSRSVPSSLASSRDSSIDRSSTNSLKFSDIVDRIWNPKARSNSRVFSSSVTDVSTGTGSGSGNALLQQKRKKLLLRRSESLRTAPTSDFASSPRGKKLLLGRSESLRTGSEEWTNTSDLIFPNVDFTLDSPVRERSLDRVQKIERRGTLRYSHSLRGEQDGKARGFVHRFVKFKNSGVSPAFVLEGF